VENEVQLPSWIPWGVTCCTGIYRNSHESRAEEQLATFIYIFTSKMNCYSNMN